MADAARLERIEDNLAIVVRDLSKLVEVQTHIVHILEDSRRMATRVGKLEESTTDMRADIATLLNRTELQSHWLKRIGGGLGVMLGGMVLYAIKTVWSKTTGL